MPDKNWKQSSRIGSLSSVQIGSALVLAISLNCAIIPVAADPAPVAQAPSPNTVQPQSVDSLIQQLAAAKEIHFDAIVSGTDQKSAVGPVEISGILAGSSGMNVNITKGGKVVAQIVGDSTTGYAYSSTTNTYTTFPTKDAPSQNPLIVAGSFIASAVGKYTAGSYMVVVVSLLNMDKIANAGGQTTPIAWVQTEDSQNGQTMEHASITAASPNGAQTVTVNYTASPWSLKEFHIQATDPSKTVIESADVVYSNCDLITDPAALSAPKVFEFTLPAGAKLFAPTGLSAQ